MIKKIMALLCSALMITCMFVSCGKTESSDADSTSSAPIEDGYYLADFTTDGSMFHVNEACAGKALLYVMDGKMTVHIVMTSENIVNLFLGSAEDAQKSGAALLNPVEEPVTYSDGLTETVYAYDVPVPVLDEEFDCAIIGTKGTWYDHKVSVSNPTAVEITYADVTLEGGSGKASVDSPAAVFKAADNTLRAVVTWSSSHYEYMTVGDCQYYTINSEGNSTFCIPVVLDEDMAVSALTTAMSEPHLIDYTLRFTPAE